jgi:hypothetical protein
VKFANSVLNNFSKKETKKWLFSNEKFFDFDGMYNTQNDREWAVSRQEADRKGGVKKKHKFPTKVMVWLDACCEGLTSLVILDNGTVDHERYIDDVLPMALECRNKMMRKDWAFQ